MKTLIGLLLTALHLLAAGLSIAAEEPPAKEPRRTEKAASIRPRGATRAADEVDFTPLFDGKTLRGWTIFCRAADRQVGEKFWSVEGGCMLLNSMGNSLHDYVWLATEKEYRNFVLRLRFQVSREVRGNSGVQVRSRYDRAAEYMDGPQVDINPPGPWRTGMIWDETRGVLAWLYPALPGGQRLDPSLANPQLRFNYAEDTRSWNDLEITADGMKLKAVLNGVTVMQYDGTGVLDDETHRAHSVGRQGVIALQVHRHDQLKMRFKDLRIKEISPR